jgi:hypothetical protein
MGRDIWNDIESEFLSCLKDTVSRTSGEDGHRPFHSALLSEEVIFWSRFERSFSTSFGQKSIERISKYAAIYGGASEAESQRETTVTLPKAVLEAINQHIADLRSNKLGRAPDWTSDVASCNKRDKSSVIVRDRVISDLWWVKDGKQNFMSIKTVKPNIDQTAEAKRDLLRLTCEDGGRRVYYGLYYNPYGEIKTEYNWTPPNKVFDMQNDECVLIGEEYWETLGGEGFYGELLTVAQRAGSRFAETLSKLR